MRIALGLFVVFSLLMSLGTCVVGKSAIHEIESLIWLLIGAVLFVGISIVDALKK